MYYDGTNFGINQSSPTCALDITPFFGDSLRVSTSYQDTSVIWAYRQSGVVTNKFRVSYDYTNTGFYIYDISNSATRLYINNSGDVGIGTTTPTNSAGYSTLSINGSTGGQLVFQTGGTYKQTIYSSSTDLNFLNGQAGNLTFGTNNTERMRIDSSGNVGIGTSSPSYKFQTTATITAGGAGWVAGFQETNREGGVLVGSYGAASSRIGAIQGVYWGNSAANLLLNPDGGNVGIGTSSPPSKFAVAGGNLSVLSAGGGEGGQINVYNPNDTDTGLIIDVASADVGRIFSTRNNSTLTLGQLVGTGGIINFATGSAERARISAAGGFSVGTTADPGAGAIYATGNITAYYSDDRLKTKLGGIENALDKVDQLNGFYYEANETAQALGYKVKREVGVSAQDVQAVLPEIVAPAPIDEKYMTIHYERLVPLLIEAIKELRAEVKALKEK
jgi:hypothetical protein